MDTAQIAYWLIGCLIVFLFVVDAICWDEVPEFTLSKMSPKAKLLAALAAVMIWSVIYYFIGDFLRDLF